MDRQTLRDIRRFDPQLDGTSGSGGNPPDNDDTPPPAPTWKPEVEEPDPDLLPDEDPAPNPDENRDPPLKLADSPRLSDANELAC